MIFIIQGWSNSSNLAEKDFCFMFEGVLQISPQS